MGEIEGVDNVIAGINGIAERAQAMNQNPTLAELFPDEFIQAHTRYQTLDEIAAAGNVHNAEDLLTPEWSAFVAGCTDFESWQEMKTTATNAYVARHLGL